MSVIQPYRIDVDDAVLTDLRARLAATRLLPDSPRRPPSGMTSSYLADLVESWIAFDWRKRERWLNRHPQFLVDLHGSRMHVVHRRSENPGAPALLIMHGWPHTFAMQLDFADLLDDVHVVVPSFPGFGFSTPYADAPMTEDQLARSMQALMTDVLGYERYFTYGEDVSANINDLLAATYPRSVRGVIATHAHFGTARERADPEVTAFFARLAADHTANGAYGHVQATRPDTLAAPLNDSPAGLLAWLVEKFAEWSDTGPDADPRAVETRIGRDRLLTEATLYWVTQSIGTSFRPYYEGADQPAPMPPADVPAAVFIQRHEHDYPEVLARRFYRDLRVFERLDEGGHFTVAEIPDAMAARVRAFLASV
ncbi:epoxide hydrolase family protein [Microbacterium sp. RD1]|uniref:epoxide hydrolase family protein n=1 Tax=Microbacterium sp. RD1 TaxID=3457313 RepID=UPI003FA57B54